ncbi:MAG: hypothetical protein IJT16_03655 [Lachnospiraceae bacterium]|nr:hypothetical protein [Lachnospiraceae bacterium]
MNKEVQEEGNTRSQRSREMKRGKWLGCFGKVLLGLMVLCSVMFINIFDVKAAEGLSDKDTIVSSFDVSTNTFTITASLASKTDSGDANSYALKLLDQENPSTHLVDSEPFVPRNDNAERTITLTYSLNSTNMNEYFPEDYGEKVSHTFYATLYNEGNTHTKTSAIELTRYKVTVSSNNTAYGTVSPTTATWGFEGNDINITATPVKTAGSESAFVSWTGATFEGADEPTTSYKVSDKIVISSKGNTALATFAPITIDGYKNIPSGSTNTYSVASPTDISHYSKVEWTISEATNLTAPGNGKVGEGESIAIAPVLSGTASGSFKITVTFYDQSSTSVAGSKTETINVLGPFSILTQQNYGSGTATPTSNGYKVMQKSGSDLILYVAKDGTDHSGVSWTAPTGSSAPTMPSSSRGSTVLNNSTFYYAVVKPSSGTGQYRVTGTKETSVAPLTSNGIDNLGITDNTSLSSDITLEVAEIKGGSDYLSLTQGDTFSVSAVASTPVIFDASRTAWDTGTYTNLTFEPASKTGASIKLVPNSAAKAGDTFTLTATLYDSSNNKVGVLTKSIYVGGTLSVYLLDDYITAGYDTRADAYLTSDITDTINWRLSGAGVSPTSGRGNSIKFQGKSGAFADSSSVTVSATAGALTDSDEIIVYRKPSITASTNSSSVTISWQLPDAVNNGLLSGTKQVYIDPVDSGYYLLMYGGSTLSSSTETELSGSTQYSASSLNSQIRSSSGSAIEALIYPQGSGTDEKKELDEITKTQSPIYGSTTIPVASVRVSGNGLNSATYYGIVGTPISITASSSTSPFLYWTDSGASGNTSPTRTITIPSGGTSLTGVAGARSTSTSTSTSSSSMSNLGASGGGTGSGGGGGGTGYDSVPKTGQGNTFLYVLIAMLTCAAFATVFMVKSMRASAQAAGNGGAASLDLSDPEKSVDAVEEKDDWNDID